MILEKQGDPLDDPEVITHLERLGTTADAPPAGTFDNLAGATGIGLVRGAVETGGTQEQVGNWANQAVTALIRPLFPDDEDGQAALKFVEDMNADAARKTTRDLGRAEQELRPDPLTTGKAGQISSEIFAVLPRTIAAAPTGPVGMALVAGGPAGVSESARLQSEGVDPETANQVGAITGIATGIGATLPAGGVLKAPLADAGLALAGNVGLGVADRYTTGKLLTASGYTTMGAQYDAFDKTAMTTDAVFSLLLSGVHHSLATDAALTNRNADHAARGDGLVPVDPRSAAAVASAKQSALQSLLSGQPVNVGHVDAELLRDPFHVRELPEEVHAAAREAVTTADIYEQVTDRIIGLESGGKARAKNPKSSATGAGQFIESTWLNMLHQHRPDLKGSRADLLAMRNDPDLSRQMTEQLARDNGAALEAAGVAPTPQLLYAAHHFGSGKAIEFARASGDTPMRALLSESEIKANPYLAKMSKDEVLANWQHRGLKDEGGAGRPADSAETRLADEEAAPRAVEPYEPDPRLADMVTPRAAAVVEGEPVGIVAKVSNFISNIGRKSEDAPQSALPADDPQIAEAKTLATEVPSHPVMVGFDEDGQPNYRPLSEVMTDMETEHGHALREAGAFEAAASCFARRGAAIAS